MVREAATACATCGLPIVVLLDDANREVALVQSPVVAYSPPRMRGGPAPGMDDPSDWEVRRVYPLHPPFCTLRRRRDGSTIAPPMGRRW